MPQARYSTKTVYGPFHRLANPRTQDPAVMRAILESGELWGHASRFSNVPSVKAYHGPLPGGRSGFEFYCAVPPDQPVGSVAYWHERGDGRVRVEDDTAKVEILITRVEQEY